MCTGGHFADLIRQFEAKADEEEAGADVEDEEEEDEEKHRSHEGSEQSGCASRRGTRRDSSHSNEQSGAPQSDQSDLSARAQLAGLRPALPEGPKTADEASLKTPSSVRQDPANGARLTTKEESASGMPTRVTRRS